MKKKVLFMPSAGPQGHHEGSDYLLTYVLKTLGPEYNVLHPAMPDPENPSYEKWKQKLKKELDSTDDNVLLVGHSLGGSVLLKYLSETDYHKSIAGLFLVAVPYWGMPDWEVDEYVLHEDFSSHLPPIEHIFLYHSNDDEVVPVEHLSRYAMELTTASVRQFDTGGHLFSKGLPDLIHDIKSVHYDRSFQN